MSDPVNFKVRVNNDGMLVITADPSKKGNISSTGKSFRVSYVDGGYGGFMKLDSVSKSLKGMSLQFQLIRSVNGTKNSAPVDDDDDNNEPAPRKSNKTSAKSSNKTSTNKKTAKTAELEKRGRGRPKKVVEDSENEDDAKPARGRKGVATVEKAKSRRRA